MELQHVDVKIFLDDRSQIDLGELIPVFHGWIQDQICEELLVDVADYRHVHQGPGVILVGHEADYSLDNKDGRLGVRYKRKAELAGGNRERIAQAFRAALLACDRLDSDPRLEGRLRVNRREAELVVNDRMLAPNVEETFRAIEPDLMAALRSFDRAGSFTLGYNNQDPRRSFSVSIRAANPLDLKAPTPA